MKITKETIRMFAIGITIAAIIFFLYLVKASLYPFIIGALIAYILKPVASFIERKGMPPSWAIVLTYSVVFSVIILVGSYALPILINDLEKFGKEIPALTHKSEQLLAKFQIKYQSYDLPYSLKIAIDNFIISTETLIQRTTANALSGIINIVGHGMWLLITPILAFYFLYDRKVIADKLITLVPRKWRARVILLFKDIDKVLGGVIRGQVTVAATVGIIISIGLYFLDVPFPLLIGILAGLLDLIPYFGPFIGAAPAVALALLESPTLALKVILLFVITNQIEGNIIGPKILGEKTGLHPLSVIFFVIAGGELFGVIGMLLAVPTAAISKVILQHFFRALL
ncbi:AI-2E family transporter [Selenomonadales bacterium OttesenSCG-928-I06]|nr:AI-2E family transporter [Selenomonadales bacterium OttesenSCG-928-I06]